MGSEASRIPGETGRNSAEIKPFVVARPTILVLVTRYRKDEPSWERALNCSMLAPQQRDQFAVDRWHQRRGYDVHDVSARRLRRRAALRARAQRAVGVAVGGRKRRRAKASAAARLLSRARCAPSRQHSAHAEALGPQGRHQNPIRYLDDVAQQEGIACKA